MLESQRREMMETMGVKILLPRFQMPAAKISPIIVEQTVNEVNLGNMPDSGVSNEASLSQSFSQIPAPELTQTGTESVDADSVTTSSMPANIAQELNSLVDIKSTLDLSVNSKGKAIKFRYRLVRVGELIMVLDQPSIEWQESKEAKQFFSDIYFALTAKKPEYFADTQFDWPPSKQFPYAHDKEMARQTLHSFMQEQMQQPPCSWILVWDAQLAEHLFESMPKVSEVGFINEIPVLLLDSMQHYWQMPASKHLLWQSLQTVKKSLSSEQKNG